VVPVPLTAMGRFSHEAVCVDPATGIVYETEDEGDSGFFRFLPADPSNLAAGGELQMLKIKGVDHVNLAIGQQGGRSLPVEWVTIDDPDPAIVTGKEVYDQGAAMGGASFRRLEGCWFGNGAVYFNSTDGGDAGQGQIWEYKPAGRSVGFVKLVYESPGGEVLSFPDNITVTPRGGLLLCEDHSFNRPDDPFVPLPNASGDDTLQPQYLKGLTRDGRIVDVAANLLDDRMDRRYLHQQRRLPVRQHPRRDQQLRPRRPGRPWPHLCHLGAMGERRALDQPRRARCMRCWRARILSRGQCGRAPCAARAPENARRQEAAGTTSASSVNSSSPTRVRTAGPAAGYSTSQPPRSSAAARTGASSAS